jgi:ferric-dicitrate binding protein FerR (iron transport regulator)
VKLRASDTHKRLSGDFETDSLEEILALIEQVLEVKVMKDER